MNEKNKQCRWCDNFLLYYTCGCETFYPQNVGLCQEANMTVSSVDCCEKWKYNNKLHDYRKQRVMMAIISIRNKLEAIERTIQKEVELDNINKK